jgi:hypothetical protein
MADDPREFAYVGDHAVNIESGALLGPGDRKAAEHQQLVAQAKALDIRGRTNMSDSELRKAIDERQNEEG